MPEISGPLGRSIAKVRLVAHEFTALSPATMRAIAANTMRMAKLDRRDRALENAAARAVSAGRLLTGSPIEEDGRVVGATVAFERATLEVRMAADDLVCLSWGPDDPPNSWALDPTPDLPDLGQVSVTVGDEIVVGSQALEVRIGTRGVQIVDAEGRLRYHELAPLRRGAARIHRRILRADERVAGLGEQAKSLDLRGETVRLWNRDPGGAWGPGQNPLYCSIPVMLGRHADGDVLVFHENSFDATIEFSAAREGQTSSVEARFVGGMIRTWVAIGDHASLLERYTGLTGRHPMPPRWALGYHQCRWGYRSSEELGQIVDGFVDRRIPLSALYLDIDYMDRYRVFSVDEERFGGLVELAERAGSHGARMVTILDPAVRREPGYDVYDEGIRDGHFVTEEDGSVHVGTVWPGWAVFPDFTRPATRAWWASHYHRLLDHGIAGIWHDMNEPTSITLAGDRTIPRSARHDNEGRGGDHREAHNVYGHLMNAAGHDALRSLRPDRRPFIVSRAGAAGMQRHAWNWTADVESSRKGLAQQIPTFLGLGLSGVAFTGSDIGGFSGIPSPALYVRWLELGILSPFCRTHSVIGAPPREPWAWPEEAAAQIERLIALRYRLLPYLYTAAEQAARTGTPLLRPLWWGLHDPSPALADCTDALLIGDDLLFAQLTEESEATREVPLPGGYWWRFEPIAREPGAPVDAVELVEGGGLVTATGVPGAPMLFVRAGSVLALDDAWRAATTPAAGLQHDHAPAALSFHVFADPEGTARGRSYDDEGDGDGPSRVDVIALEGRVLTWRSDGAHPRPGRIRIVLHGIDATEAIVDGVPLDPGALFRDGASTIIEAPAFDRLELA